MLKGINGGALAEAGSVTDGFPSPAPDVASRAGGHAWVAILTQRDHAWMWVQAQSRGQSCPRLTSIVPLFLPRDDAINNNIWTRPDVEKVNTKHRERTRFVFALGWAAHPHSAHATRVE